MGAAAATLLSGCGGPKHAAPSGPMYVNVKALAHARPEWLGVTRMDQQVAALEAERVALLHQAAPGVAVPPAIAVPVPQPLVVPPPTTKETPPPSQDLKLLLAQIKRQMAVEAQREQTIFARKAGDRYVSAEFAAKTKQWDSFTGKRSAILERYNAMVTALVQKEALLTRTISQPDLALAASVTSGSSTPASRLASVKSKIDAEIAAQDVELLANFRQLQAVLDSIDADYRARIARDIRAQQAVINSNITHRINVARSDIAQENALRSGWFLHKFENPARQPLPMALRALKPEPVPAPPRSSPADLAAAIAQQESVIRQQRSRLASFTLADTQDWVAAIASRQNLAVQYKPGSNLPDETARFAAWLRQRTIPA